MAELQQDTEKYVELRNINKTYGTFKASNNINLGIGKGKLIALLGPSGSGKTTILRMIAGLETADSGDIIIDGKVVNDVPASKRGIGFVFQNYALFRYMTVYDNIAFGLKVNKWKKSDIKKRVDELIELVGLSGMAKRYPSQLSGGQRQRVAFARALAPNPELLLLDEPFAAIDAKVRQELRSWLRDMITKVGITSIFVTHDQDEAIEVADEIIVTNKGHIEQIGTPRQIYREPETAFMAEFMGHPVHVDQINKIKGFNQLDDSVKAVLRPENVNITKLDEKVDSAASVEKGVVVGKLFMGKEVEIDAICDGSEVFIPGIMELVERTGVHSGDSTSVYPPFSISQKVRDTIAEYTTKLGLGIGIVGLFNIQFIVDSDESVYVIEVNPRASRSVPFLSKSTDCNLVRIATKVMLGQSLRDQGITDMRLPDGKRWYVKAPAFSFEKLTGMDAYLSPEMKSTGEAIGYDKRLNRALYKALQASGVRMKEYGTVIVTLADEDKEEALPLVKRFYHLGFNIEATAGTAAFLKKHGIRTRVRGKLSEGSTEILDSIRAGYVSYVINTRAILSGVHFEDGVEIRRCAVQNGVTIFTSLDTVKIVLDVLEEITPEISTINGDGEN